MSFRVSRFAFLRRETLKIKREKTSAFLRRERENRFRVSRFRVFAFLRAELHHNLINCRLRILFPVL